MDDIAIQIFSREGIHVALVVAKGNKISSIGFSFKSVEEAVRHACEPLGRANLTQTEASNAVKQWASEIQAAIQGKSIKFTAKLDFTGLPEFTKRVYKVVQSIPSGYVASYSAVATGAGNRNAVRAVGNAMARNPFVVVVPCHRVVRSDLSIGQYGYGTSVKRRLLELEGVRFEKNEDGKECVSRSSNYDFK